VSFALDKQPTKGIFFTAVSLPAALGIRPLVHGSEFKDLVQYNDGFRTGLIGTPEQIAGREVLPIVRSLEAERGLAPVGAAA